MQWLVHEWLMYAMFYAFTDIFGHLSQKLHLLEISLSFRQAVVLAIISGP